MMDFSDLYPVAIGDVDAEDGYKIIRPLLNELDEKTAQNIYTALRAWLWKALNERRRDGDLKNWINVFRAVRARFEREGLPHAEYIRVLYELLQESISVADKIPVNDILQRSHVREIILLIQRSPAGIVARSSILDALGFKDPNLSRVMNLLLSNGVVERHIDGKATSFSLTVEGLRIGREIAEGKLPLE